MPSSWSRSVGERWGSRLASANRLNGAIVAVYALLSVAGLGTQYFGWGSGTPALWLVVVVAFALSYATPILMLRGNGLRGSLRAELEDAGLSFAGTPPIRSAAAFRRWLAENDLDPDRVRSALSAGSAL